MNIAKTARSFCFIAFLITAHVAIAEQDEATDDANIKTFLHDRFDGKNMGMVIGIVDEHQSRVFGAGSLDNGTSEQMNGDTIFEIGSITKTFTALLLQDMVERGEMKLDDPVAKYLPASVSMPTHNGKQITLLNLAAQDSGLPFNATNLPSGENPFANYTSENLYTFLSGYTLTSDPGTKFIYSNLGVGLLGHAISLKAGVDYESLAVDRICRPLHMDSTRISRLPESKSHLANGHNASSQLVSYWNFQVLAGCGALRSTANDLLKYVSANLGLTQTALGPLMEKTHVIRHRGDPFYGNTSMPWVDCGQSDQTGMQLLGHAGGTAGYSAFIGFDTQHRRGVVVLLNQQDGINSLHSQTLGWLLLEGVQLTPHITATLFPPGNGELVGIGAKLAFDPQTRTVRIDAVFPNAPASQAGLTAHLILQKIDDIPTADKSLDLCACLIRGNAGTKVRLELLNPQRNETSTVEVTRQHFTIPNQN
jgi:serine-type D-Ala-D-Ala carboxypeptidase/endopeptidase